MKMKKTLLISLAAMTLAGSAYAMRPGGAYGGPFGGPYGAPPAGPPPVAHLQEILDLSDEQAESLKALFKEQRAQRREHRKARAEMRKQMHENISKILSEDQLEEFEMIRGNRKGKACRYRR